MARRVPSNGMRAWCVAKATGRLAWFLDRFAGAKFEWLLICSLPRPAIAIAHAVDIKTATNLASRLSEPW